MPQVDEVGFSCTACGRQYRWKAELAGKTVKCKCGSPVKVPRGAGAPAAAARSSSAPASHVPPPPPPPPKRAPAKPVDDNDADFDALAALAEQEEAAANDESNFCPNCRNQMMPDAVLCTSCGFDRRKGKVVAAVTKVETASKPKKSMFGGGGSSKPGKPGKKKVTDALAPQGSFWIGAVTSVGMAIAASIIYAVITWALMRFVGLRIGNYIGAFVVAIIGLGAGIGMQIGQKGYSTAGGLVAAGIAFVSMIVARLMIFVLLGLSFLSGMGDSSGDDIKAPDPDARLDGRVEVKSARDAVIEMAAKEGERRRLQQEEWDRQAKARGDVPKPPEDPRILQFLREKFWADNKWDPNFANGDQHQAARNVAEAWATTMPADEKKKIIAVMDVRLKKERDHSQLIALKVQELESQMSEAARSSRAQWQVTHDHATGLVDKMSPDEQTMELVRLEKWAKEHRSAEKKKEEEELATDEAEEKAAEAADASKTAKAGGNDGLDEEPIGAASKPAANGAQPTAVAANGKNVSDGLDEEGDESDDAENTSPAAAIAGNNTAVGQAAAVAGPAKLRNQASSDESSDSADMDDGDGSGVAGIVLGVILYYVFIGSIWNLICMISAIFLAYRTAAGSVGG